MLGSAQFQLSYRHIISGCIVAMLLLSSSSVSQRTVVFDTVRSRYGIFLHYHFNKHRTDFRAIPGIPNCCPQFTDGSGSGITIGALYEIPVSRSILFGIRPAFSIEDALLEKDEPITLSVDGIATPGIFRHIIDAKISSFGIEPQFLWRISNRLMLHFGFRSAFLMKHTFSQKEELLEPIDVGTFENGKRIRNEISANIPRTNSLRHSLLLGGSYEFPLNKTSSYIGAIELLYAIGRTPVVKELDWYINTLRLGVALKWSPKEEESNPQMTTLLEKSTAESKHENSNKKKFASQDTIAFRFSQSLRIEEYFSQRLHPLLPFIFFGENTDTIPSRYRRLSAPEASEFLIDQLHSLDALPMYYQLLNIVGRRMIGNPKAKLNITGCNSDDGLEKNNLSLSHRRAISVRNYLRDVWRISELRLTVAERNLPEKPSYPTDPDGIMENQRVELSSDTWEILEPIFTRSAVRIMNPEDVDIAVEFDTMVPVKQWSCSILQNEKRLASFSGVRTVPQILSWKNMDHEAGRIAPGQPLIARFVIEEISGKKNSKEISIPIDFLSIERKIHLGIKDEKQIDRYNLIHFDFDSDIFTLSMKRIMDTITTRTREASRVSITGYTDRMGDGERNRSLSEVRAQNTKRYFASSITNAGGMGEFELYDNDLPEGRFYNRTVEILAEIQKEYFR